MNPDEAVSGKTDFGVAVLNVFNYVLAENDVPTALKQVNKLLEMFKTREQLDETDVHKWFTANYGEDIDEVFGAQSDYNKGREVREILIGFRRRDRYLKYNILSIYLESALIPRVYSII